MVLRARIEMTSQTESLLNTIGDRYGTEVLNAILERFFAREAQIVAGAVSKFAQQEVFDSPTGQLGRSIVGQAVRVEGLPAIRVGIFRGPALAYAGVQEFGTEGINPDSPFKTIKPVSARALAVPLDRTDAGVARDVSPTDAPEKGPESLTFIRFPSAPVETEHGVVIGGLFTQRELASAERSTDGAATLREAEASWLLMTELDLEPKEYLLNGLNREMPKLVDALGTFLRDYLEGDSV